MDKYIVIERHKRLGGTWYANQYPGCACDVPSNLYSFSFEPNPKWSYFFGRQPEIAEYLEHCADKYDLRRHIKFDTTVTEMKWIAERQVWEVSTKSNDVEKKFYARFIMAGYGPLSNASYPTDIEGIDQFEGQMCHTAEWDKSIDFEGKRVAVIGTGASAVQTVPEVHKMGVKEMFIFQRTAPWVIPRADRLVKDWEKKLFARFPIFQKLIRGFVYWIRESTVLSFVYRLPVRFINQELVKYNIRREVKDEALRKKLTPKWDLGCKRVLITNDWYPTIQKPNVKIVSNRIQRVTANSIVTFDGDEYPVDVIIWSTGFLVQKFPIAIYGEKGISLIDQWAETMQVSIPNWRVHIDRLPFLFFRPIVVWQCLISRIYSFYLDPTPVSVTTLSLWWSRRKSSTSPKHFCTCKRKMPESSRSNKTCTIGTIKKYNRTWRKQYGKVEVVTRGIRMPKETTPRFGPISHGSMCCSWDVSTPRVIFFSDAAWSFLWNKRRNFTVSFMSRIFPLSFTACKHRRCLCIIYLLTYNCI